MVQRKGAMERKATISSRAVTTVGFKDTIKHIATNERQQKRVWMEHSWQKALNSRVTTESASSAKRKGISQGLS